MKKWKRIVFNMVILALFFGVSRINFKEGGPFEHLLKERRAEAASEVTVTSHKKFVNAVYKMTRKRETSGSFYYEGNSDDIFDGDIDRLLDEVCAIDKKTSDDADYLMNSISTINCKTSYRYYGDVITDSTITVQIRYLETMAQLQAVNEGVAEALAALNIEGKSDYKKVKLIHDFIVENTRYQTGANCYTAYGALLEGRAVCQGYAQLAYKMLTEAGLKCYFISGKANNGTRTEDHAWNLVKVGKKWYYLDVTWDDPVGSGDTLRYDYFLLGSERFTQDHMALPEYSKKIVKASKYNHKKAIVS